MHGCLPVYILARHGNLVQDQRELNSLQVQANIFFGTSGKSIVSTRHVVKFPSVSVVVNHNVHSVVFFFFISGSSSGEVILYKTSVN